jgi:hypothetical protein
MAKKVYLCITKPKYMSNFQQEIAPYFNAFLQTTTDAKGDWTVKGFIDIYKNIYTISVDTKVISKIIELMIFPTLAQFANDYNYEMILSQHQNHYPDLSFRKDDTLIALDLKSTYRDRVNDQRVNGMTLGAFTGYFRNRSSDKNITFPYEKYNKHFVLGCIYDRVYDIDERRIYNINDLTNISSVIKNLTFFVQEKWRIATDRPGSGNTKNIGSETDVNRLVEGLGLFTRYQNGEQLFNNYWMNYLTQDMAKALDYDQPPYHNLTTFFAHFSSLTDHELLT